jgi:hypothetical protein
MSKNIYILPTDKISKKALGWFLDGRPTNINIYITLNQKIKEGIDQWYLDKVLNEPYNSGGAQYSSNQDIIILTTDEDLIKDGVQAIDDDFVSWLCEHRSCEYVEVETGYEGLNGFCKSNELISNDKILYRIVIPKETLEEAAEKDFNIFQNGNTVVPSGHIYPFKFGFIKGAKWQAKQLFKDVAIKFSKWLHIYSKEAHNTTSPCRYYQNQLLNMEELFQEFLNNHYGK